jgi:Omp85 superfamily domain
MTPAATLAVVTNVCNRTIPLNYCFSEVRRRCSQDLLRFALFPLLALGVASGAVAQVISAPLRDAEIVSDATKLDAKREGSARFFDPEDGQLDLSYFLEDPHGVLPIPIVVTEPAVGYGGGVAGMFLRPRREAGDEGWARPDISAVGAFGTQNGTWGAFAGDASRWVEGRLRTLLGVAAGQFNLDFFGLGNGSSSLDQGVRYSLQFAGAVAQANWQLAPKSPWAVGLRYVYADVDPKARENASFQPLADQLRVKISAPTAIVEFDTRDNLFTPTRGIYAESSWLASRQSLGASDDFERFQQVLIGWHPLSHDVTLGARVNYGWSSDGTPFFLRPFVQLRGVPALRYQGDQAASVELEARWQFLGRWSVVAFGGAGTTRTNRRTFVATQNVGSGGVGFRYELASKFGIHAGIDLAHSPGTTAAYFVVGNAWFRP